VTAAGFGADRFGWTDEALAAIAERRGWTEAAIERLELTFDSATGVVGFPIIDATADTLGVLRYLPYPEQRNGKRKTEQPAGVPRQLFPPPETIGQDAVELVVTEGEPDQVAATSAGYTAVAVPGVEGWKAEYAARFAGRRWTVFVVFDADAGGRRAAHRVAGDLAAAGVDARVVDLAPERDDGYDVTDYLLEYGGPAFGTLLDEAEPYAAELEADAELEAAVIEPLRAFLARDLPPAESLVGVARGGTNLLPRYGWVLPWGREGSGKTSVLVDLLFHVAAGVDWLHYHVERPLRVVVVINEGVPGGLQDKLEQKLELWAGDRDAVLDNLAIYASPWGAFTFRNAALVEHARAFAVDFGADYVALDPLHTLGATGAGSPQDTEAFKNELRAFGLWHDLGVITAHHSNKAGMISGDWARHADTVFHLEKDGKNPATKITLQKARPADPHELGVPAMLEWVVETMGYERRELDASPTIVSDETLLERILEHLEAARSPVGMTDLKAAVTGDPRRIGAVAIDAITRGIVANTSPKRNAYLLSKVGPTSDGLRQLPDEAQTRIDTGNSSKVDPTFDVEVEGPPEDLGGVVGAPGAPWKGAPTTTTTTDDDFDSWT
jgi:hypothetical protein